MKPTLKVFYDGACPRCVKDRADFERLSAGDDLPVDWVDITGRDQDLRERGIDPQAALTELHVEDENGRIHRELDAYIVLMGRTRRLRWLAWLIGLPLIKPLLSRLYRHWVRQRLRQEGRLPTSTPQQPPPESDASPSTNSKKREPD